MRALRQRCWPMSRRARRERGGATDSHPEEAARTERRGARKGSRGAPGTCRAGVGPGVSLALSGSWGAGGTCLRRLGAEARGSESPAAEGRSPKFALAGLGAPEGAARGRGRAGARGHLRAALAGRWGGPKGELLGRRPGVFQAPGPGRAAPRADLGGERRGPAGNTGCPQPSAPSTGAQLWVLPEALGVRNVTSRIFTPQRWFGSPAPPLVLLCPEHPPRGTQTLLRGSEGCSAGGLCPPEGPASSSKRAGSAGCPEP